MSALAYWRERLFEGFPLYNVDYVETQFVRMNEGEFPKVWPIAIAKQTLYDDYSTWFEKVYLEPYREVPYYKDNESALPKPDDQHTFFTTLKPFLYIVGSGQQDRAYEVLHVEESGGTVITRKKRHNFIRFCPIDAHIVVFEQRTGMKTTTPRVRYDPKTDALVRRVIDAVKVKNANLAAIMEKHSRATDT